MKHVSLNNNDNHIHRDLIEGIVRTVQQTIHGKCDIYLFGSQSSDSVNDNSDIDIALRTVELISLEILWSLRNQLESLCSRDIDLVDLNTCSTVMRMQVVSKGKRIFSVNESESECFENYVFSSYARLNEERAEILKDIEDKGSVYG